MTVLSAKDNSDEERCAQKGSDSTYRQSRAAAQTPGAGIGQQQKNAAAHSGGRDRNPVVVPQDLFDNVGANHTYKPDDTQERHANCGDHRRTSLLFS